MSDEGRVRVSYFSDVLCVWAYVGQVRLRELRRHFGERVELVYRFIPVFGSVEAKLQRQWASRGGVQAYARHVHAVAESIGGVELHPDVWLAKRPKSSAAAHHFLRAVEFSCLAGHMDAGPQARFDGRTLYEEAAWQVRLAFFRDLRDVGRQDVLFDIAAEIGLDLRPVRAALDDGSAIAALCLDLEKRDEHRVKGSPTWVMDRGRQTVYGNVGYRILEAIVQELLEDNSARASWC